MASGSLLQLVAKGMEDIYITGDPRITWFKTLYRRHTEFSMTDVPISINGNSPMDFGTTHTIKLGNIADKLNRLALVVDIPSVEVIPKNITINNIKKYVEDIEEFDKNFFINYKDTDEITINELFNDSNNSFGYKLVETVHKINKKYETLYDFKQNGNINNIYNFFDNLETKNLHNYILELQYDNEKIYTIDEIHNKIYYYLLENILDCKKIIYDIIKYDIHFYDLINKIGNMTITDANIYDFYVKYFTDTNLIDTLSYNVTYQYLYENYKDINILNITKSIRDISNDILIIIKNNFINYVNELKYMLDLLKNTSKSYTIFNDILIQTIYDFDFTNNIFKNKISDIENKLTITNIFNDELIKNIRHYSDKHNIDIYICDTIIVNKLLNLIAHYFNIKHYDENTYELNDCVNGVVYIHINNIKDINKLIKKILKKNPDYYSLFENIQNELFIETISPIINDINCFKMLLYIYILNYKVHNIYETIFDDIYMFDTDFILTNDLCDNVLDTYIVLIDKYNRKKDRLLNIIYEKNIIMNYEVVDKYFSIYINSELKEEVLEYIKPFKTIGNILYDTDDNSLSKLLYDNNIFDVYKKIVGSYMSIDIYTFIELVKDEILSVSFLEPLIDYKNSLDNIYKNIETNFSNGDYVINLLSLTNNSNKSYIKYINNLLNIFNNEIKEFTYNIVEDIEKLMSLILSINYENDMELIKRLFVNNKIKNIYEFKTLLYSNYNDISVKCNVLRNNICFLLDRLINNNIYFFKNNNKNNIDISNIQINDVKDVISFILDKIYNNVLSSIGITNNNTDLFYLIDTKMKDLLKQMKKIANIDKYKINNKYVFTDNNTYIGSEIYNNLLKTKKPLSAWCKYLGYKMIENVSLIIDGVEIDNHDSHLMLLLHKLFDETTHIRGINEMLGNTEDMYELNGYPKPAKQLFIKFFFFFCKDYGNSLSMINMLYSDISIKIKLRKFEELFYIENGVLKKPVTIKCHLLGNYIYLEKEERLKTVRTKTESLIELFQFSEKLIKTHNDINDNILKIKYVFNDPCKYLLWKIYVDKPYDNEYNKNVMWDMDENKVVEQIMFLFDGKAREQWKSYNYYQNLTPYNRQIRTLDKNEFIYSLCLFPKMLQPSGTTNFSLLNDIELCLKLNNTFIQNMKTNDYKLRIYMWACNYNIFVNISGFGALRFFS